MEIASDCLLDRKARRAKQRRELRAFEDMKNTIEEIRAATAIVAGVKEVE